MALTAAFAGFFAAVVLSLGHLLDLPVPCGTSGGCVTVASHPSSNLLGVPVAFIGVAAYLTIIFLLHKGSKAHWPRVACVVMTGFGTLASAGLLVYSQRIIQATCPWCVASGVAMTLLFLLSIVILRAGNSLPPAKPAWIFTLGLITSTAIGLQAGLMQKAAKAPPASESALAKMPVHELLDPAKSIGPAEAPVTIIMFSDLWCPACRAAHSALADFQKKNPAGVRLVYRHLPLYQIRGHEFSRAAAALSEMAGERGKFWPFVSAIYSQSKTLDRDGYLALAESLGLDPVEAEARLGKANDPAIARVMNDEALAERLGINSTPSFIVLAGDYRPISANQKTLTRILNSTEILGLLSKAAHAGEQDQAGE